MEVGHAKRDRSTGVTAVGRDIRTGRGVVGLLGRLLFMPLGVISQLLASQAGESAATQDNRPVAPSDPPAAATPPSPPDYRAEFVEKRQSLLGHAKLAAVVLVVLLVLIYEYTPMVVADQQLEAQYSDQVRSLVLVEGYASELDQLITDASVAWQERVEEEVDLALRRVVALDAYDRALAANAGQAPELPAFLSLCRDRYPDIAPWLSEASQLATQWPEVVSRCIIEPMGVSSDPSTESPLMPRLDDAQAAVTRAIAQARQEFPRVEPAPTVAPPPPDVAPTPVPVAQLAHSALDQVESEIARVARIVEIGPHAVVKPLPKTWLVQFSGESPTLRSFRDNLLLAHTNPLSRRPNASIRSRSAAPLDPLTFSIEPLDVSVERANEGLEEALSEVIASQEALQAALALRTAEIQAAVPGILQPILAIARPKYLVLFYPIAVAAAGAYFLLEYTVLQNWARARSVGDPGPRAWATFALLAVTPVVLLLYLLQPYDWPQYSGTWWQWIHLGSLAAMLTVAGFCAIALLNRPQPVAAPG
jgi:hypothetical protein